MTTALVIDGLRGADTLVGCLEGGAVMSVTVAGPPHVSGLTWWAGDAEGAADFARLIHGTLMATQRRWQQDACSAPAEDQASDNCANPEVPAP
jgi:hypothetical protein